MLALNETLQTIKQRLGGLSLAVRLLIGALMTILVMTLVIVGLLAGRSTMAPLAVASLPTEARTQLVNYMDSRGIAWEERGGQLLVAADQKYAVLGELADSQLINAGQLDFETLVQTDNPFTDKWSKRRNFLIAKMNVLARTISQMDGIRKAVVLIDEPSKTTGIGRAFVPSKASVYVATTSGSLSQSRVDAIANFVVGAHADLKLENVKVVADNKLCNARTDDDALGGRYYERKLEAEKLARETIAGATSYIQGVLIAVNVQMDNTRQVTSKREFGEPVVGPLKAESETQNTTNQSGAGETGFRPNTGATIADSGGRTSSSTLERTGEQTLPYVPVTETETQDPKGNPLQINTSIGVPESFLVGSYRNEQGDETAQPDRATLDALMAKVEEKIKAAITPLIDTGAIEGAVAGTVTVYSFPDFAAPAMGGFGGGSGGAGTDSAGFGGQFAAGDVIKGVGLGSLALISLAMMFMMVRKASVRPELPSAEELVGVPPALTDSEADVVGEASETGAVLEGLEIDEDALRRQQMLDQINETASGHPDQMAALLKRWIRTGE